MRRQLKVGAATNDMRLTIRMRPDQQIPGRILLRAPRLASLTPQEARALADMLHDHADHTEQATP